MTDTYLKSKSKDALTNILPFVTNMLDITQGTIATDETTVDGVTIPAISAKGDPEYWYTCVRAPFSITQYDGVEVCEEAEGIEVCGGWV